jgi:hypothetical protein
VQDLNTADLTYKRKYVKLWSEMKLEEQLDWYELAKQQIARGYLFGDPWKEAEKIYTASRNISRMVGQS